MSSDTMSDIYSQQLLALADSLPAPGRLAAPDASAWVRSRLCGSEVTVDLKLQGDRVSDFAQEVKACKLGSASAAVMARHVVGSSVAELRQLRDTMRAMLREGGPPPEGKWAELQALVPARRIRSRHPSIMLTFDAVNKALDDIQQ